MESSKAKIEKFFGSNEKLEAIANNKEFIEKVAGGQATPETYQKELGKLGLELTLEEAKEVQTATERAMDIPPEKLNEAVLESVAGGFDERESMILGRGIALGGAGTLGVAAVGCSIAGAVYRLKTYLALSRGDLENGKKYSKRYLQLIGAFTGLTTGAVALGTISDGIAAAIEAQDMAKNNRDNLASLTTDNLWFSEKNIGKFQVENK